jgi:hypothetical protein
MSNTLAVTSQDQPLDSPGSSVFDLPVHSTLNPQGKNPLRTRLSLTVQFNQTPTQDVGEPLPSFVVISGGTGGNAICAAFGNDCHYILPVSDDGGSSSEIIRVLGGPSIGTYNESPFSMLKTSIL